MSIAFESPRRYPPSDLCYAVAVKEQEHGRSVYGTTCIVYGATDGLSFESPSLIGISSVSIASHLIRMAFSPASRYAVSFPSAM